VEVREKESGHLVWKKKEKSKTKDKKEALEFSLANFLVHHTSLPSVDKNSCLIGAQWPRENHPTSAFTHYMGLLFGLWAMTTLYGILRPRCWSSITAQQHSQMY